jgi:hypothetical protein
MAEEKQPDFSEPLLSTDDMAVLRTLLHNIKGISPVSTTDAFALSDEPSES